jgi:NADH dehydrogenase (ubiquinone) Fe-S protein 1
MVKLSSRFGKTAVARSFSTPKEIEIYINDEKFSVDPRMTIFQAAFHNGIEIPRFCYHEKLSIAGNCRMCLVEVEKAPKPVAACFAQVSPGMKVFTDSEKTRLARGAVMEFLLANHPLDCPICDQGGECDLQDISINYGYNQGRFDEYKRSVEDKDFGPIISTHMTRCIHCTRCIRFGEEIAGFSDLGMIGRGQNSEISTYVTKMLGSELSGNLADICPVGALTHGPYSFTSRPFELRRTSSIDLLESIIPPVEYYWRGPEVMRVLPKVHEEVNEEWISDKSRYSCDGLVRQRLTLPLILNKKSGQYEEQTWLEAMELLASKIRDLKNPEQELLGLIGQFTSVESAVAINDLFHALKSDNLAYCLYPLESTQRSDYLLNRSIAELDTLDVLLLVGSNPKFETPVMNARILRNVRERGLKVYKIGAGDDLGYRFVHLGNSSNTINQILEGKHPFNERLAAAQNAHIIIGSDMENHIPQYPELVKRFRDLAHQSSQQPGADGAARSVTCGIINQFVGPISGYEVGMRYKSINEIKNPAVILNFGNDDKTFLKQVVAKNKDAFIVYVGTTGDEGASYADLVLPVSAWTEFTGTYVSSEGRVQVARKVVPSPAQAKEEWKLLRTLSEMVWAKLPYDTVEELRFRVAEVAPHLLKYDHIEQYHQWQSVAEDQKEQGGFDSQKPFFIPSSVDNFYKTDAISRASLVMSKSSAAFNPAKNTNFLGKVYT